MIYSIVHGCAMIGGLMVFCVLAETFAIAAYARLRTLFNRDAS